MKIVYKWDNLKFKSNFTDHLYSHMLTVTDNLFVIIMFLQNHRNHSSSIALSKIQTIT